jgi:hypothetical protein
MRLADRAAFWFLRWSYDAWARVNEMASRHLCREGLHDADEIHVRYTDGSGMVMTVCDRDGCCFAEQEPVTHG